MSDPEEGDAAGGEEQAERPPSRSQRTRDATAVNELGIQLIELGRSDLDRLDLPEVVREAVDLAKGLKMRARSRQKRLIGQLLRAEDHEAIRQRVESLNATRRAGVAHEKTNDRWLERLLEGGDEALQAFVEAHPTADRPSLRTLARTATREPESPKTKRARRELLRAIRALRA